MGGFGFGMEEFEYGMGRGGPKGPAGAAARLTVIAIHGIADAAVGGIRGQIVSL